MRIKAIRIIKCFVLLFVFSCTVQNPMQDYQKNNNKVRSETPRSYQQNQINLNEPINVKHCTELYGCYSEENDRQQIVDYPYTDWSENKNNSHCSALYGCYSEENDPQLKIINCIGTFPSAYGTTCPETQKELVDNLGKNLENAKFQCKDLGFKQGTEKFGECVLKLSE